jgi:hypothetical protein
MTACRLQNLDHSGNVTSVQASWSGVTGKQVTRSYGISDGQTLYRSLNAAMVMEPLSVMM